MIQNFSTYTLPELNQLIDNLKTELRFIEHYETGHFTEGDLARNRTFHLASKREVEKMLKLALLDLKHRTQT